MHGGRAPRLELLSLTLLTSSAPFEELTRVAHLVEQPTLNRIVVGSNPTSITSSSPRALEF